MSLALWPALLPPWPLPQLPIDLTTFNCVFVHTSTCEVVSTWKLVVKICEVAIGAYKFVAPKCILEFTPNAIIQRSCSFYKLLQVSMQLNASSRFNETKCSFKFQNDRGVVMLVYHLISQIVSLTMLIGLQTNKNLRFWKIFTSMFVS
jgi:hypothetical protein